MRKTLLVSLPIVVAFQLGCGSQIETHISWSSCSLIEGKSDGLSECATVSLPLDDSGTVPGTIGIFVKRLRAKTQPARGQVWLTEGGPGGAATYLLPPLMQLYAANHPDLEMYAADHRGTGGSEPLTCPDQEAAGLATPDLIAACGQVVSQKWGDRLPFFSTTESARDLGRLIELTRGPGQKVFVTGASYATYHILRYLQLYPTQADGIVLDGILPPESNLANFDVDMNQVGQQLFARCASDAVCAAKLGPDPWATLVAVEDSFDQGHCPELGVTSADVRSVLGQMIYTRPLSDYIPALTYRAQRCTAADVTAITYFYSRLQAAFATPAGGFSLPLQMYVDVSEFWTYPTPGVPAVQAAFDPTSIAVGASLATAMAADSWPRYDPAPYAGQWPQTTVPMLMMNGGLDPATPLAGALTVKDHFQGPNQTFVTFADEGHGAEGQSPTDVLWSHDCGFEIVDQFFNDPTVSLDTSCLGSVLPLNFSGTPLVNKQLWSTTDVWENTATAPTN
ncbi:MAG TPA: alpha/beta fold hydrolase [Polyangia bacterium]|jgi:TAP-like protein.|nr:alpha/beta fold hydrolase [Polyangia bacterium]